MKRTLFLAALIVSVLGAACGDDTTTFVGAGGAGGDGTGGGADDGAPAIEAVNALTVEEDSAATFSLTITGAEGLDLLWQVSSETVADIAETAVLTQTDTGLDVTWTPSGAHVGGHVLDFTASWADGEAAGSVEITVEEKPCFYPGPNAYARGTAFPDHAWNAQWADGTQFTFDLYDFHCDDEIWGAYDTLIVSVSTIWCPNCPNFIAYVDALGPQLEEEGALVLFLDVQDEAGGPVNTAATQRHISRYAPNGTGIRAGDADNTTPNAVLTSPLIEYFPTAFVIRRSDMQVIADARDSEYYLPLVEIAMDPTADWSSPGAPTITPEFPSNCGEESEEIYEPNDTPDNPAEIGPGTFDGGVCNSAPDYYSVDVEGPWEVLMEFSHATGDLDIYVWDDETGRPMVGDDGRSIGGESIDDDESFQYEGPATLFIYGYNNGTAPYTLTITELDG